MALLDGLNVKHLAHSIIYPELRDLLLIIEAFKVMRFLPATVAGESRHTEDEDQKQLALLHNFMKVDTCRITFVVEYMNTK